VAALRAWLFALAFAMPLALGAQAQSQAPERALQRAMDLENASKYREAVAAYREALSQGAFVAGILGLERSFGSMGQEDSLLPAIDTLLRRLPREPTLRGALLRTLRALGRDAAARRAFDEWRSLDPRDAAPYREYARLLLTDRRAEAADSVLKLAVEARGGAREFATEFAELYSTMGRWDAAASAWREAVSDAPYLDQSAVYSLMGAPAPQRDGVRAALSEVKGMSDTVVVALARTRAGLELRWGAPRAAWRELRALPASDSTAQVWIDFADEAERTGGALAARDALVAAWRVRKLPALALRAATAALAGDDATGALAITTQVTPELDSAQAVDVALPLRVRALVELARPQEAELLIAGYGARVSDNQRRVYARALAWGWIRAGDVARARRAAEQGGGEEEDVVSGWLALFDGDLETARRGLRTAELKSSDVVTALAFISRTRQTHTPGIGAAFLALARGDSALASRSFEQAAEGVPDAAPFLLGLAARVASARRDDARAIALWKRLVEQYAAAPEAPEADLEWARTLERHGDRSAATARYEHLILTWPDSALVPQARQALDRLRALASTAELPITRITAITTD
jgi:tetratricopeptide (TPR) repeat protein